MVAAEHSDDRRHVRSITRLGPRGKPVVCPFAEGRKSFGSNFMPEKIEEAIARWMHDLRDATQIIEKMPASVENTNLVCKVSGPAHEMQMYLLKIGKPELLYRA